MNDKFRCPITYQIFCNPVKAKDGIVYEERAITSFLEKNNYKSPHTMKKISSVYEEMVELKEDINKYLNLNPDMKDEQFVDNYNLIKKFFEGDYNIITQITDIEIEEKNYESIRKLFTSAKFSVVKKFLKRVTSGDIKLIKICLNLENINIMREILKNKSSEEKKVYLNAVSEGNFIHNLITNGSRSKIMKYITLYLENDIPVCLGWNSKWDLFHYGYYYSPQHNDIYDYLANGNNKISTFSFSQINDKINIKIGYSNIKKMGLFRKILSDYRDVQDMSQQRLNTSVITFLKILFSDPEGTFIDSIEESDKKHIYRSYFKFFKKQKNNLRLKSKYARLVYGDIAYNRN